MKYQDLKYIAYNNCIFIKRVNDTMYLCSNQRITLFAGKDQKNNALIFLRL